MNAVLAIRNLAVSVDVVIFFFGPLMQFNSDSLKIVRGGHFAA